MPQDNNAAAGTGLSVPTTNEPAIAPAQEIHVPTDPGVVRAAESLGLAKIKGPKELGLTDEEPAETQAKIEARLKGKSTPERDPETGKFKGTSQEQEPPAATGKPTPKSEAKPAATPEPAAKLKIGDKEQTAEEWAKDFADMKAKAEAAKKPTEPAKTEPAAASTPEQRAAADRKRDDAFVAAHTAKHGITQDDFDAILASGDVKAFNELFARMELNTRYWAAQQFNPIIAAHEAILNPVAADRQEIAQYRAEQAFLGTNPDIAEHEKGRETYRQVASDLNANYQRIQEAVATGKATQDDMAAARAFEQADEAEWEASIAAHARQRLNLTGIIPTQPATAPAAPKAKAPVVERPLDSDRPGSATAPRGQSLDQRIAAELFNGE